MSDVYCLKEDCPGHELWTGTCNNAYGTCCGVEGAQVAPLCAKHSRELPGYLTKKTATTPASQVAATLDARGKTYGGFAGQAVITQALKDTFECAPRWDYLPVDMKEALDMIASKIARILNGDPTYIDNWHDIQGYAALIEKRLGTKGETSI